MIELLYVLYIFLNNINDSKKYNDRNMVLTSFDIVIKWFNKWLSMVVKAFTTGTYWEVSHLPTI